MRAGFCWILCSVGWIGGLTACGSPSSTPAQQQGQAVISWKDTLVDLGNVQQGKVLSYTFVGRNTGKGDLQIMQAVPSCGCTVVSVPNQPIHPAQEVRLTVHFHTAGQLGDQLKKVFILCNAQPPEQTLYLKAHVIP
ncbi:MAG: DUF1573 domain-containing protein [Thermoflavifilum sp.]|nr:DUF1573 domain-containing protein [Thermoflavifilum sp.]